MRTQVFGKLPYGQPVQLYEIENKHGMVLSVINYGARIVGLKVPSLNGPTVDVICGFKTLEDYLQDEFYFGAIVGRIGGRICPTQVTIDGKPYHLTENRGDAHLHGGLTGFDKVLWNVDVIEEDNGVTGLRLRHVSPAGTEGYPGEVVVEVEYRLTNHNELIMNVKGYPEETTILSIPNHSYFNLGGKDDSNIYDHYVSITAESYLPVNANTIPTGEIAPVENTVYDLRKMTRLGEAIPKTEQNGFGYDDFWVFAENPTKEPRPVIKVYNPRSGITMDILTTQPGVLMYTGNYLHKSVVGKYGEILDKHSSVCFETQHHPNAINTPAFPSTLVRGGETYSHTTVYRFSVAKLKEFPAVQNI